MNHKLKDLLDIPRLRNLLDSMDEISRIPCAILDTEGNILTSSGWQDVCTGFHRANPETARKCIASDSCIHTKLFENSSIIIHRCPMGLIDSAAPIIIEEQHIGNVFVGQLFMEPPDENNFISQARKYGFDEEEYLTALRKVPLIDAERLQKNLAFIKNLTQMLAELGLRIKRQRKAESALLETEKMFSIAFDNAPSGMSILASDGRTYLAVNPILCEMFGYSREEFLGNTVNLVTHPDDVEMSNEWIRKKYNDEPCEPELEKRYIHKDGHIVWGLVRAQWIKNDDGTHRMAIAHILDITQRKQAEEALKESERRFVRLFESAPIPMAFALEKDGFSATTWNEAWYRTFGYGPEEARGKSGNSFGLWVNPEDRKLFVEKVRTQNRIEGFEALLRHRDGEIRICEIFGCFIGKTGQQVLSAAYMDITERKDAEAALRESESYNKVLFYDSFIPLLVLEPETGRFIDCNKAALKILGFTAREQLLWKTPPDVSSLRQYDGRLSAIAYKDRLLQTLGKDSHIFNWQLQRPNGKIWDAEVHLMSFSHQKKKLIQVSLRDITRQKQVEKVVRESEERFSKAFSSSPAPLTISNIGTGRYIDVNDQWMKMLGYTKQEAIGHTSYELKIWKDPDVRNRMMHILEKSGSFAEEHVEFINKSGEIREVLWSAEVINLAGTKAMLSLFYDFTDKKKAEDEKTKLQSQLLQAQKLEAVGRLAGGLAHDYNNMLGVIIGHTELALLKENEQSAAHNHLVEINNAAKRSGELTQQILAFARRQTVAPKVLNLNDAVNATLKMLKVLLGEDIELNWIPGKEIYQTKIDPSQFDQLLVNLSVNARDAINGVGRITIETQSAVLDEASCLTKPYFNPGDYAVIIVSDNGSGMDEETQSKIFEPFFTTKGIGKGTGLGLATVYGIVKQNNGFINVYSELGRGTTFKVYLPSCLDLEVEDKETEVVLFSRGETVLIVEDEVALLQVNSTMLSGLGYNVITAGSPSEAVRLGQENAGAIDLLLTDVVMPDMNGRELLQEMVKSNPNMRCLFTSGYTANVISHHGVLDSGVQFIQKPFTLNGLAKKVREALR